MYSLIKIAFCFLLVLIGGCAAPGFYEASYRPSANVIDDDQAHMLAKGVKPRLIEVEDFDMVLQELGEQNYIIVGRSEFSAQIEKYNKALEVAKGLRATHVLVSTKYLYNGTKRASKFHEFYDVSTEMVPTAYGYRVNYVRMPNMVAIPYLKTVPIYHHRAAYLVRRK